MTRVGGDGRSQCRLQRIRRLLQQAINWVMQCWRRRVRSMLLQELETGLERRGGNSHSILITVNTEIDPFRLNQVPGPEPVAGLLPTVWLVEDEDALDTAPSAWMRVIALIVITLFLMSSW